MTLTLTWPSGLCPAQDRLRLGGPGDPDPSLHPGCLPPSPRAPTQTQTHVRTHRRGTLAQSRGHVHIRRRTQRHGHRTRGLPHADAASGCTVGTRTGTCTGPPFSSEARGRGVGADSSRGSSGTVAVLLSFRPSPPGFRAPRTSPRLDATIPGFPRRVRANLIPAATTPQYQGPTWPKANLISHPCPCPLTTSEGQPAFPGCTPRGPCRLRQAALG